MSEDKKPLPLRRRAQLVRILQGESIAEASRNVGYASKQSGFNALADTRKRLAALMDHYGLTENSLVSDYILPLLNAERTEFASYKGKFTDERTVPDFGIRKDTLGMVLKIRGAFPKEQSDGPSHLSISINSIGSVE